tara:strand:+ start:1902 stop:2627 length:726 start_codon:yes stop_codon:yes gene_type:complete
MKKKVETSLILSNPNNPRLIKNKKFIKLVNSIKDFPEMLEKRPIVVDESMMVLGGNMRLKACREAGLKDVWIDVAEGWTDKQKKEFIVKDNVSFGEWDWDILANDWEQQEVDDWGLDVWQEEVEEDNIYTRKIIAPTYEPKNKKPNIEEVLNKEKTNQLIDKIKLSNLDDEEKNFLIECAFRHTVFDYSKIADYYAHSNKEVQQLMEESALVIIDFEKAIEQGYVKLTKKIAESFKKNGIL